MEYLNDRSWYNLYFVLLDTFYDFYRYGYGTNLLNIKIDTEKKYCLKAVYKSYFNSTELTSDEWDLQHYLNIPIPPTGKSTPPREELYWAENALNQAIRLYTNFEKDDFDFAKEYDNFCALLHNIEKLIDLGLWYRFRMTLPRNTEFI